jgi:hypothetical protein
MKGRIMIWLWLGLGTLALLAAIVLGVGWMLPVAHVATRSLLLQQPPEAVWDAVTDVGRATEWRKNLKRIEVLDSAPGRRRWREIGKDGTLTLVEDEAVRGKSWVTRIDDPALPFGGRWRFEFQPDGEGCRIRITEEGEVYNPAFRFLSRFVFGHAGTLEAYLANLAAQFEEKAEVER